MNASTAQWKKCVTLKGIWIRAFKVKSASKSKS